MASERWKIIGVNDLSDVYTSQFIVAGDDAVVAKIPSRDACGKLAEALISAANRAEAEGQRAAKLLEAAMWLSSNVQRLLNWREDKSPYTRAYCEDKVRQSIKWLELVAKEQATLPAPPKEVSNG